MHHGSTPPPPPFSSSFPSFSSSIFPLWIVSFVLSSLPTCASFTILKWKPTKKGREIWKDSRNIDVQSLMMRLLNASGPCEHWGVPDHAQINTWNTYVIFPSCFLRSFFSPPFEVWLVGNNVISRGTWDFCLRAVCQKPEACMSEKAAWRLQELYNELQTTFVSSLDLAEKMIWLRLGLTRLLVCV